MRPPSSFSLAIDHDDHTPLFIAISRAVARDIARGRLRPGDAIPGTRTLAATLGVHRSTVVAAYAELVAQGWVATKPGGATEVATAAPGLGVRREAARFASPIGVARRAGFRVDPLPVATPVWPDVAKGAIELWGGVPDLRLVPVELLSRAYRRAARRYGATLLGYNRDVRGHERLRRSIAQLVSSVRGVPASEDDVFVTRGSQMALDLIARSLISPGDVVAIEALTYTSALNVFRRAGAEVVPIPVDGHGLDTDALAALSEERRVRLVYITPHHQYPTTVTLSPTRRLALLHLARQKSIAVIEDDYDNEFHFDGRPVLPLALDDPGGVVIYLGTLAKILAPGLRLGFVIAARDLLVRMALERALVDRQGDAVLECAVAELLEDGEVQRHVWRTRRIYHGRRDALCAAIDHHFENVLAYVRPPGGLALWAQVHASIDLEDWRSRAAERGVHFQTGSQFAVDGSFLPFLRLGYATLDERALPTAIDRMLAALPSEGRLAKRRRGPRLNRSGTSSSR
jgi:GntR family transcriptional regulator/MocR family aminotransferase